MLVDIKRLVVSCVAMLLGASCAASTRESVTSDAGTLVSAPPLPSSTTGRIVTTAPADTGTVVPWTGPCGRPASAANAYDHVIWIWMENKNESSVFESTTAPFLHSMAASCGSASNYVDHGLHPSLPNYLAATSGDPQGVADDAAPAAHPLVVDNIFRQVRALGKQSKSYQEAMPGNCELQSTDRYAVKHNPAAYYVGQDDRTACLRDNVALDLFLADLQSGLPEFSLITPDICNDMHDCPIATGDAWLQTIVDAITSSALYRDGRTAVFIVFDESEGAGTMPFVAIAPSIVPGTRADAELDHYALLAFTEDALGVASHLGAAANAASLAAAFGL